jgi:hypothetical protein
MHATDVVNNIGAAAVNSMQPAAAELISMWNTALAEWAGALRAYATEVGGSAGIRVIGSRWTGAVAAVNRIEARFHPRELIQPAAAALMAAGDAGESAEHELDVASVDILNPNIQYNALAGMSRTYSDSIKRFARAIETANVAAISARRDVMLAVSLMSTNTSVASIAAAYATAPNRGSIATEVYVSALVCRALAGHADANPALEGAKCEALGGAADTIGAATRDHAALAEYHPLQVMTYTPMVSQACVSDNAQPVLDLTLPQARLAVTYNIAPLTQRTAAAAFGKLATTVTGLNYRLVERLRTIVLAPLQEPAGAPPRPRDASPLHPAGAPLRYTIANGTELREFAPRAAPWLPLAGCTPRVLDYGTASAAVIMGEIRADREIGWGTELRGKFEAAVVGETIVPGICGAESLVSALMAEFGRVYDIEPPVDIIALGELVTPLEPGPETYIGAACAKLAAAAISDHLKGVLLGVRSRRVPYADIEREIFLTQAVQARSLAQDVWRRIRAQYYPDPTVFTASATQLRALIMRAIRKTFAAVGMSSKTLPIICMKPSLKIYAATLL